MVLALHLWISQPWAGHGITGCKYFQRKVLVLSLGYIDIGALVYEKIPP